jgi:hypothetical protein
VLLVLAPELQALPWESLPALAPTHIYRCPDLPLAAALAARQRWRPDLCPAQAGAGAAASSGRPQPPALDLQQGYYLLNPDGDLEATEATFLQLLAASLRLPGQAGSRPTPQQLSAALQGHALFLYFGHGAGDQYLPGPLLRRLDSCGGALLMGCSSGRLRGGGRYEPSGAIWSYLMAGGRAGGRAGGGHSCCCCCCCCCFLCAGRRGVLVEGPIAAHPHGVCVAATGRGGHAGCRGRGLSPAFAAAATDTRPGPVLLPLLPAGCPAAVANLWDVTDRDIDRFSSALLEAWGAGQAREGGSGGVPMAAGVAASRGACRLRHLIGAAPVVYGIPALVLAER